MTFFEAFALYGPDTIAISEALNIPEHEADRLVNERMDRKQADKARNLRIRDELSEIRSRRPA